MKWFDLNGTDVDAYPWEAFRGGVYESRKPEPKKEKEEKKEDYKEYSRNFPKSDPRD